MFSNCLINLFFKAPARNLLSCINRAEAKYNKSLLKKLKQPPSQRSNNTTTTIGPHSQRNNPGATDVALPQWSQEDTFSWISLQTWSLECKSRYLRAYIHRPLPAKPLLDPTGRHHLPPQLGWIAWAQRRISFALSPRTEWHPWMSADAVAFQLKKNLDRIGASQQCLQEGT